MLKKVLFSSLIAANLMAMHQLQLDINDVDLEAGVALDMGQFNEAVEPNTTFVGFRYLKPDKDYSDYPDPNAYVEASFFIQREVNDSGFLAGMGVKLNYINNDGSTDFMSIPLSFRLGYTLTTALPVYLGAEVHYAPKVLSLQEAESYLEYRVSADIEVIENALITVGFRDIETKYEGGGDFIKYNRAGYIGFKFNF